METIALARRIGTYETSILPFDDCCSLFVPAHPATRARVEDAERAEAKLDIAAEVAAAVAASERIAIAEIRAVSHPEIVTGPRRRAGRWPKNTPACGEVMRGLRLGAGRFSGGVDSALLLRVAADVLGERCHGADRRLVTMAASERRGAVELRARARRRATTSSSRTSSSVPASPHNPTDRC